MIKQRNIAFFTEMNFVGKVPRNHPNMRTEMAWMNALDADHFPIDLNLNLNKNYDLSVIIVPKKTDKFLILPQFLEQISSKTKKTSTMQEGPNWYWQDYSIRDQILYFNTLSSVDFLFVHNEIDKKYYTGLTGKESFVMPSLMITDHVKPKTREEIWGNNNDKTLIGGNFVSWYGGIDSYMVAREFETEIFAPQMGRMPKEEIHFENLGHLPYMNWLQWMETLSTFKYAVHLMRTHAAGTFALNCAYMGIPVVGYQGLDTQEKLHPKTSVQLGDIRTAKSFARRLKEDKDFYIECSETTIENYQKYYSEENYLKYINSILKKQGI